ncbi:hypothetical protein [Streptomyces sp. NPDC088789]|uniref:hypothetical protein n=1 Tax=Streptomyces sp. NPDC088789 TaxID=3365899 RepID=UPI00381C0F06
MVIFVVFKPLQVVVQFPGNAAGVDRKEHKKAGRPDCGTGETTVWHLNFGPADVGVHRVSLNTALGRHTAAVRLVLVPAGLDPWP